jgi:hypothetical protein
VHLRRILATEKLQATNSDRGSQTIIHGGGVYEDSTPTTTFSLLVEAHSTKAAPFISKSMQIPQS